MTGAADFTPEPVPRYRQPQQVVQTQSQRQPPSRALLHNIPAQGSGDECARAKADRDNWERQVGMNRTIDGLRYWQDRVYDACK